MLKSLGLVVAIANSQQESADERNTRNAALFLRGHFTREQPHQALTDVESTHPGGRASGANHIDASPIPCGTARPLEARANVP